MIRNCLPGAVVSNDGYYVVMRSMNSETPDKVPRNFAALPEGHSGDRNL